MVLEVTLRASVHGRELCADLDTRAGTLVMLGPNGAGKTTLLETILGAHPVREGRIVVGDEVLLDRARGIDVPIERRALSYVPQGYGLFPHLSVRGNLELALRSSEPRLALAPLHARCDDMLKQLDCHALAERRADRLSGGERQRVALARALVVRPRALLLDEPLAALDALARREVRELLASYLRALSIPCLLVIHDPDDARVLGASFAVMEDGRITQRGGWDELVAQPASEFVRALVHAGR